MKEMRPNNELQLVDIFQSRNFSQSENFVA